MPKPKKPDYALQYRRRIERGLARGLTRQQARGHGGLKKATKSPILKTLDPSDPLFRGFEAVRQGEAMTPTAKKLGISPERLSRFIKDNADVERRSGRLTIKESKLISIVTVFSHGRSRKVVVDTKNRDRIVEYMTAVEAFLANRNVGALKPFEGEDVTDTRGNKHRLETNPNRLLELEAAGEREFLTVYKGLVAA